MCQARYHRKRHIRVDRRGSVTEKKCSVHGLLDFAAFYDKCSLYPLAGIDKMMMYSTYSQKRRDGDIFRVDIPVSKDNIVDTFIDTTFSLSAKHRKSLAEILSGLFPGIGFFEEDREFLGLEPFVTDVAKKVQLRIGQYGVRQPYHLAVVSVRGEDSGADPADILEKGHYHMFPYGIDGRVRHLGELLPEIVE